MFNNKIIDKHFQKKKYLHFDRKKNFFNVKDYVTNPNKIAMHGFLPLIHYVDESDIFTGQPNPVLNNRPIERKPRDIMYAGHLDNFIYKYYSVCLNHEYNKFTEAERIDKCSIAYRDNKPGMSNINFAAEIINTIVNFKSAFIFVGDFTSFFASIDHRQLKKNIIKVLDKERLPSDWYNVYRSLTKYGYYSKDDINNHCGSDRNLKKNGRCSYFGSIRSFREYQKKNKTSFNNKKHGIPQGTALSGVFANVYAINFDFNMQGIAERYSGIYRRYSDDFILVIPQKAPHLDFDHIIKKINDLADDNIIDLQPKKTHTYKYVNQKIIDPRNGKKSYLDYLGFIFDGKSVQIRPKSPYKFYRNAMKLINKAHEIKRKKNLDELPYKKKIYRLFTDLGAKRKPYGNFITYTKRAQNVFDKQSPHTQNLMLNQIKNRKKKLEKALGFRLHIKI